MKQDSIDYNGKLPLMTIYAEAHFHRIDSRQFLYTYSVWL